jgi:NAD(P)-dependent dehydrogenase (short-subunit alcohol dehydrogenase family)
VEIANASAIVTGGASGLGAATARELARRGAQVVVLDRQIDLGMTVADEIGGLFAMADVAVEDQVIEAIALAGSVGPLRVLVNCAGTSRAARTMDRNGRPFDLKAFEFIQRVNLTGHFNCIRLAAVAMSQTEPLRDGERGSILNTASVAAFDGQVGQVAYSASKAAIVGMTLPVARDLAVYGIRINTIAPGLFDTPIYGSGPEAEAFKAKLGESVVFPQRLGRSDEFATMAIEVLTNSYMNGESLRLDGAIRMPPK